MQDAIRDWRQSEIRDGGRQLETIGDQRRIGFGQCGLVEAPSTNRTHQKHPKNKNTFNRISSCAYGNPSCLIHEECFEARKYKHNIQILDFDDMACPTPKLHPKSYLQDLHSHYSGRPHMCTTTFYEVIYLEISPIAQYRNAYHPVCDQSGQEWLLWSHSQGNLTSPSFCTSVKRQV